MLRCCPHLIATLLATGWTCAGFDYVSNGDDGFKLAHLDSRCIFKDVDVHQVYDELSSELVLSILSDAHSSEMRGAASHDPAEATTVTTLSRSVTILRDPRCPKKHTDPIFSTV